MCFVLLFFFFLKSFVILSKCLFIFTKNEFLTFWHLFFFEFLFVFFFCFFCFFCRIEMKNYMGYENVLTINQCLLDRVLLLVIIVNELVTNWKWRRYSCSSIQNSLLFSFPLFFISFNYFEVSLSVSVIPFDMKTALSRLQRC